MRKPRENSKEMETFLDLPFLEANPVSFTLFTYSLRTPSSSTEESENPREQTDQTVGLTPSECLANNGVPAGN